MGMGHYTVLLLPGVEDDGYTVTVPLLPGCITEGETLEEALAQAREVILAFIADMRASGEPMPQEPMPAAVLERALADARAILQADARDAGRPNAVREPEIAAVDIGTVAAGTA